MPANYSPDHNLPEAYRAMVLLVDDQAFVADAVRLAIARQDDIDLHYCPDPCQTIEIASRIKPTVILLDLVMPNLSGLTLVRQLRNHLATSEIPIVVLSVTEEARTKSDAFALGANDYLVKLPDAIELRARIRYHSMAYLNRIQRNEAFNALRESQQELVRKNAELSLLNQNFERALEELRQVKGLLPICSCCKRVRDDRNYWQEIEAYLAGNSDGVFSRSYCPECLSKLSGEPKE